MNATYFFIESCSVTSWSALLVCSEGDVIPDRSGLEPRIVGGKQDLVGQLEGATSLVEFAIQCRNLQQNMQSLYQ